MKKIYVIKMTNGTIEDISSAVTSKKLAETLCEYKNLEGKRRNSEWSYYYEEEELRWNLADYQWLKDQVTELRMKELPY